MKPNSLESVAVLVIQEKKNAVQSVLSRGVLLCLVPPLKSTVKIKRLLHLVVKV